MPWTSHILCVCTYMHKWCMYVCTCVYKQAANWPQVALLWSAPSYSLRLGLSVESGALQLGQAD